MSHEHIVLGWARANSSCSAAAVVASKCGPLNVLAIDGDKAADARTRLKRQMACFELGLEFLPVAPRSKLCLRDAIDRAEAQEELFLHALDRLSGKAQLTLGMTWSGSTTSVCNAATTGREWLRAQTQSHAAREAVEGRAASLLDALVEADYAKTTRNSIHGLDRDVLVPKGQVKALIKDIVCRTELFEPGDMKLIVSGPWPPFSFVQRFLDKGQLPV